MMSLRSVADPAATVAALLAVPDEARIDYAAAKLAIDRLIDDSGDPAVTIAAVDRMAEGVRRLAGAGAGANQRLVALRRTLYEPGPWNDRRPFAYDHDDPLGRNIANKLLAHYLATRRGNCVSMPILFLILADRLDLDVTLATAPLHIFARYRDADGGTFNIETSNGGHPARDDWYIGTMGISRRAIASGLYLRSLSRRENVALMATTLVEHLLDRRRYAQAAAVCAAILRHAPRDGYTMAKLGSAYGGLLEQEFLEKYPKRTQIPVPLLPRYRMLAERSHRAFAAAESLGWEPVE